MGRDEQMAFELLKKNREIHKPLIKQFHGTWIKELGDGVLASFHTVTDAVFCAEAIHQAAHKVEGLQLRIGIHLGEVIFENNDVFGDGVNIASRLQAMAFPGSTWVSEAVQKNLVNKQEIVTEFIAEETLKNVSEPVKIYKVELKEASSFQSGILPDLKKTNNLFVKKRKVLFGIVAFLVLATLSFYFLLYRPEKGIVAAKKNVTEKSIAVLPFKNMSDEKENRYFADGMMDEILNKLSRIKELKVISRTSVEQYRDTKKTTGEIAKELGVAYILEGSAQKYGDQIKVIVQLIRGETGYHEWSQDYVKTYKEVFVLHAEIANNIADELEAKLSPEENVLIRRAKTANIEAYDLYLRGMEFLTTHTYFGTITLGKEEYLDNARSLLYQALAIDAGFAQAWASLGREYLQRHQGSTELLETGYLDSVLYFCNKAITLDAGSAEAYATRGSYYFLRNQKDKAIADEEKAISINPSYGWAYMNLGSIFLQNNDYVKGLTNLKKAAHLIKGGDELPILLNLMSDIYSNIGNFQLGDSLRERSFQLKPDMTSTLSQLYWSSVVQGKKDRALYYAKKAFAIDSTMIYALWRAYADAGDFPNALKYMQIDEEKKIKSGYIGIADDHRKAYVLWNSGKKDEARKYFEAYIIKLKKAQILNRVGGIFYDLAATYAFLGKEKEALEQLRSMDNQNFSGFLAFLIIHDPLFNNLRNNNEFKEIVSRAFARTNAIGAQIKELEMKGKL
jgi:TolB-like protein/Tfp pilus assembly protein PilF